MIDHTISVSSQIESGRSLQASIPVQGTTSQGLSPAVVPPSTTDQLYTVSFAYATLKEYFLLSNVDLTIETNNGTTPGNTINLTAGIPHFWFTGAHWSNEFTVNVTAFYLTNGTTQQARLECHILN